MVNKIINPESNYYCYVGTVQEFVSGDLKDNVTHDVMVTSPWKSERTTHSFDQKGDFPVAFHHPGDVNMCLVITLTNSCNNYYYYIIIQV